MRDEIIQRKQRFFWRYRPAKGIERSRMVREITGDIGTGFLCQCVRSEPSRSWHRWRSTRAKAISVVCIKIPLPTNWLAILHENTRTLSHPAVEELHPQTVFARFITARRPLIKLI